MKVEESFDFVKLGLQHNLSVVIRAEPGRGVWTAVRDLIAKETGREVHDLRMTYVDDFSTFVFAEDTTAILLVSDFQSQHVSNALLSEAIKVKPKGLAVIGVTNCAIEHVGLLNRVVYLDVREGV